MTQSSPRPWRTGTSPGVDGRTIYSPIPGYPRDKLIGVMDTAEDATLVVSTVNGYGTATAAGPGHHVLVTVDPARNHGRASISRGMVPIWAAAGLLWAEDPVDLVRDQYGLTEAEVAVVAALAEDFQDLCAQHQSPPDEDACRVESVTVDGHTEVVRVRGHEPMTDLDKEMFGELVAATRLYAAQHDRHLAVRQGLAKAWMKVAARIPDGPEKTALRTAVVAAQAALTPPAAMGDDREVITE